MSEEPQDSAPQDDCEGNVHEDHAGIHSDDDNCEKVEHDGHLDHLHDGHRHFQHGDHVHDH